MPMRGWMGAAACALALTKPGVALADVESNRLSDAFFGGRGAMSADLTRLPQWRALLARERKTDRASADKPQGKSHEAAPPHLQTSDLRAELDRVQRDFSLETYATDETNWGVSDYWATSAELHSRGGDCEDFATAKYFALRALGIAADDMRVAIVVDDEIGVRHAVLLVRIGDEVFALDNRRDRIVRAAELAHYRPLLAMNEAAWWMADEDLRQAPDPGADDGRALAALDRPAAAR
jgi:predicted transglutaminase-like cysteine proteinase